MRPGAMRVVFVRFDDRPHEWRSVRDPRGYRQLVDDIMSEPAANSPHWVRGHRDIIVGDDCGRPDSDTATILSVVVNNGYGAAYYRDVADGVVSGWVAENPEPFPNPPRLVFSSQGWNAFPATAVLSRTHLRELVEEFVTTGHRPECVTWQDSEWIR